MIDKEKIDYLINEEKKRQLFWEELSKTIIACLIAVLIMFPIMIGIYLLLPLELQQQIIKVLKYT